MRQQKEQSKLFWDSVSPAGTRQETTKLLYSTTTFT